MNFEFSLQLKLVQQRLYYLTLDESEIDNTSSKSIRIDFDLL